MATFVGLSVDNKTYRNVHVASLKRDGEILDGKNAGRVQSGDMTRDVIGTFYNYTMQIEADHASVAEYDELYQTLTAPTDYHNIGVPYGQTTIYFKAYVSSVSDELKYIHGSEQRWGSMTMKFVALGPYRR